MTDKRAPAGFAPLAGGAVGGLVYRYLAEAGTTRPDAGALPRTPATPA